MKIPESPKVSIVTPSFNQGRFIRDTIESVLSQNYPYIEYIVMDGGSTDETLYILREYEQDPRLYWESGPDGGQAAAINKGFRHSSGQVLAWLNSDDFYLPGAVRRAVEVMYCKQAEFVFGDAICIDENSQFKRYLPLPDFQPVMFKIRMGIHQPSTFWTRTLFERVNGVNETFHCAMDRDLFWRMSRATQPVHIPQFLSALRMYPDTKTARLFGTIGHKEIQSIEQAMGESLPLWMVKTLPNFHKYPVWLQFVLRGLSSLYNTPIRFIYAPSYLIEKTYLGIIWSVKSALQRNKNALWAKK